MKHLKKYNQVSIIKEDNDSWKKLLKNQVGSGKYWKNLFKDNFETHKFLDKSDVITICKRAQADIYEDLISKLKNKVSDDVIDGLNNDLNNLLNNDYSDIV